MTWRSAIFRQLVVVWGTIALAVVLIRIITFAQLTEDVSIERVRALAYFHAASTLILIVLGAAAHIRLLLRNFAPILKGMSEVREGKYPLLLVEGEGEYAELFRGFNQMVEELRSREERLRSWVGTAESEVSKLSQEVHEEREKLEMVLDHIGDGVIVLDEENKVLMVNPRVSEIFGLPISYIVGNDFDKLLEQIHHRLVHPDQVEKQVGEIQQRQGIGEVALELDTPGGPAIRLFSAPVRGSDGKVLGRIATMLDLRKERELEQLKSEFLSTISHELRTPLTSVKGALGLIRGGAAGPASADMRELLDIAAVNVERLVSVINNILDVFSFERGQSFIRIGPMSLRDATQHVLPSVGEAATQRQVTIELDIPSDLPALAGDSRRVEQVLFNLLSNAVKFSAQGSKVTLAARATSSQVTVSVKDCGQGITPEFMGRLFGKFEHPDDSLTRENQGAGLGLAICRHIVEAHGGRIWAESEVGRGATFFFTLSATNQPLSRASQYARPEGPKLVLVIDDDPDVTRVISFALQSQGHRVLVSNQGEEAVALARRHNPDLLTLDLNMPNVDGFAVLKMLRTSEVTKRIPIICISVEPDSGTAVANGADYYLEKPVDIRVLREVADQALSKGAGLSGGVSA